MTLAGIPSADAGLFDPHRPATLFLVAQALADLMGRVEIKGQAIADAAARISTIAADLAVRYEIAAAFMSPPVSRA